MRHPAAAGLHPQTPGKQRRSVPPDARPGVAEHDHDHVAAWARTTANQTMSSSFCESSLHPVAVGQPFEDLVRVLELAGAPISVAKDKLGKANDRSDSGVGIGRARDDREIACG